MKARIEREWTRDAVKVWLYQPGPNMTAQVVSIQPDGELLMVNVEENATLPAPSFILPTAALEALVKEASGILPPSETTVDAMRDGPRDPGPAARDGRAHARALDAAAGEAVNQSSELRSNSVPGAGVLAPPSRKQPGGQR